MTIFFSRQFEKQIDALKNPKQRTAVRLAIDQIASSDTISEIKNVKKLKGHSTAYRIRVGDYRIGFYLQNQHEILIATIMHRRDIYKKFP